MLYRMKKGVGPHSMKLDGKNITLHPGDEVRCEPEDIGGILERKFEALEPPPPEPSPTGPGLTIEVREDGKCDVINKATGNKINDEPLTAKEAAVMVDSPKPSQKEESKSKEDDPKKGKAGADEKG